MAARLLLLATGAAALNPRLAPRPFVSMSLNPFKTFSKKTGAPDVSTGPTTGPITAEEVTAAQKKWSATLVEIGKIYTDGGDYKARGAQALDELYGYSSGLPVLFKPTKAAEKAIRLTEEEAASYFVGDGCCAEDTGFAITPFINVEWDNQGTVLHKDTATAMGEYVFTTPDKKKTKVEYTFKYQRGNDGDLKIVVHHSSIPFSPKPAEASITEKEVAEAQKKWSDSLVAIGKTYTDGGDYRAKAKEVLDTLYGYNSSFPVLFKPTKAKEPAIRLTEAEAASYFVGEGVCKEDKGFAITPFTNVKWDNKGTIANVDTATAMGEYYFTDGGGGVTKAEYTFEYKRGPDGDLKIVTHHSSVPYKP